MSLIICDADYPSVENGRYHIGYIELTNGYRHAFYDERVRHVRYSRKPDHPADPRCPECNRDAG
ncbi:MAG TPA: hypothetical protein VK735_39765 [Pseudonocardia sp.]|uniref:hypothetical protein n=1 Tax=Pseudonocardia sp. TaxID=60912 RepID=UPI002D14B24B|nr:hypothetical protein [Pseudonocardia sp.]HTF53621.1 hypothetical protein [Pseudonocardia sp.]